METEERERVGEGGHVEAGLLRGGGGDEKTTRSVGKERWTNGRGRR
jgi:hypothetical protein